MSTAVLQSSDTDYQLGWERIFGSQTSRGSIHYLPSEAGAAIVQYDPDFRISCLIPPTQRRIQVDFKGRRVTRDHDTPFLILSHLSYLRGMVEPECVFRQVTDEILATVKHFPWCYCSFCARADYRALRTVNPFYLFAVDTSTEQEILAQPYRINNVYFDGKCCFRKGNNIYAEPRTLKQAHVRFWMDYFSDEFLPDNGKKPITHSCRNKSHLFNNHYDSLDFTCKCSCCLETCECECFCRPQDVFADFIAAYKPIEKWENHTQILCGNQFLSYPKKVDAIFTSADEKLLKSIPQQYIRKSPKFDTQFIIGFANLIDNKWDIDLIGLQFTLNSRQVVVLE